MATPFTVESVNERQTIDAAGQLVNVTAIHLRTMRGARGSIELPTDNYMALTDTADGKTALLDMLQSKAGSLDAPFEL